MLYKILADAIMVTHFAWILFMLAGFIFTLCGFFWKSFFDKWLFRTLHLCGIAYVSLKALTGEYCPLTIWENSLRAKYDPSLTYAGSFMVHYAEKIAYPDINPLFIHISTTFIAVFTVLVFIIRPPAKIKKYFNFMLNRLKTIYIKDIITLIVAVGCVLFIGKHNRVMAETKLIQLPKPFIKGNISLEEVILRRRSERSFKQKDLTLQQISQLLWAAQGITLEAESYKFRTAPSAGALYPMEIYLLAKNGLFRYLPDGHKLELLGEQDLRGALAVSSGGQVAINQAPVNIVICAVYSRLASKYGQRGIRYAHIEAGHIAQNIHLQAAALGLGSLSVGAFNDEEVKKILSLPANHEPVYIIPAGYSDSS